MDLAIWLPSIGSTSALVLALWLGRNLIKTRLVKSVEHEFNTKLESLRSEFRRREEELRADLRAKEADITTLRNGAMTAMASRQMALDQRRLQAVDQLWSAISALLPAKGISSAVVIFNFEGVEKEAVRNEQFREMLATIGSACDLSKLDLAGAERARPFVSPMAWALYSAYQAIVIQAVVKLQFIKCGLGTKNFSNNETIARLVKTVLPHQTEYIDKYGDSAYHYLLDELEARILEEFQKTLAGQEADKASVEKAAEILKLSNQLAETNKQSTLSANSMLEGSTRIERP